MLLHLQGACKGCPSAALTLKAGIEELLKSMVPRGPGASKRWRRKEKLCEPGGIRTPNLLIRSQMLFQLSYGSFLVLFSSSSSRRYNSSLEFDEWVGFFIQMSHDFLACATSMLFPLKGPAFLLRKSLH